MTLFLSGGGSGEDSRELDKEFIKKIGKTKPVLYIPLARESPYEPCLEWIKSNFKIFQFNKFEIVKGLHELKNKKINDYSGIYIGGGNTYKLLKDLKVSGFLKVLTKYVNSGGIVYGGSAGAIIFGREILTANDSNEVKITDFKGLNKVGQFSIYCHYSNNEKKKVEKYVQKNEIPVIALPEKTGMIIDKDKVKIVGMESAYIFDGKNWTELFPNNKFNLT